MFDFLDDIDGSLSEFGLGSADFKNMIKERISNSTDNTKTQQHYEQIQQKTPATVSSGLKFDSKMLMIGAAAVIVVLLVRR